MSTDYKIPECDTFGYCVKCGKRMIDHAVVDGIYKIRLTGEYTTVNYKLNDGSLMRVAMCRQCSMTLTGDKDETDMVMRKVWRGWQNEVETYSEWTDDKKKEYLDKYGKLRIVTNTKDLDKDTVETVFENYKKNQVVEVGHIMKEAKDGPRK